LIGIAQRTLDPQWQHKNLQKNKDPAVRATLSKAQANAWNDPEKANKRLNGQKEFWSDEANRAAKQDFYKSKKFMDAIDQRSNDPEFGRKISKGKMRPIVVPWGIFPSKRDAEQGGRDQGIKNIERLILKGLKEQVDQFFYVSKEEYILLTGLEP
jgi:hypothetical protein